MKKKLIIFSMLAIILVASALGTILIVSNANKAKSEKAVADAKETLTLVTPIESDAIGLPSGDSVTITWVSSNLPLLTRTQEKLRDRPIRKEM